MLLCVNSFVFGQFRCETYEPSAGEKELMRRIRLKAAKIASASSTSVVNGISYIPVQVHIVQKSDGTGGATLKEINHGLALTNKAFLKSQIQFYFCNATPHYINSDKYYDFDLKTEADSLSTFSKRNTINVYYFNTFSTDGSRFVRGGYAFNSYNRKNMILMSNDIPNSIGAEYTLAHELGHYFGLLHTFENSDNTNPALRELVTRGTGRNCETAGDSLCDTPADPNGRASIGLDPKVDDNGEPFAPDNLNLMSYSFGKNYIKTLTEGQTQRIKREYNDQQLWAQKPPIGDFWNWKYDCAAPVSIGPINLIGSKNGSTVTLAWEGNISETGYFIERSTDGVNFITIGGVGPVEKRFTDLEAANTTYFYRVKASNSINAYSNIVSQFTSSSISAAAPNKMKFCAGDSIQVSFQKTGIFDPANPFVVQVLNSSNQLVSSSVGSGPASPVSGVLPSNFPTGNYKVRVALKDLSIIGTESSQFVVQGKPSASLSGNSTITAGQSTTLTAFLFFGGPWNLTLSDGQSFTNVSPSSLEIPVSPAITTSYTITKVSNACATGTTSGTATVTVLSQCMPPTVTVSGNQTITAGQTASIKLSLTGSYPWNVTFSDGSFVRNLTNPTVNVGLNPTTTTTYSVETVSNACGSAAGNGSATVTVIPVCTAPAASLSGSQTVTTGQSASLGVSLTGTGPWSFTLSDGHSFSNVTTSPFFIPVTPATTTTYTISRVANACGSAAGTGSATVTVAPPPCATPTATLTGSQTITLGQYAYLNFAFTGSGPWSVTLSTGQNYSNITSSLWRLGIRPTSSTVYTITRVANTCGEGTGSGVANVTVLPACVAPGATLSGSQTVLAGQSAVLTPALSGNSPWSLTLSTGQVFTNLTSSPAALSVTPAGTTTYSVARVGNACGSAAGNGSATLTVVPPCTTAAATLTGSRTISPGQSTTLSVALTGTSPWSLTLSDGQVFSGLTNSPHSIVVSPTSTTTYTITRVSNACGIGTASGAATISVCSAPGAILSGSQTIIAGQSASLNVALTGTGPWSLTLSDGRTFSNVTTSPYSIPVTPATTTTYSISRVANTCGSANGTGSATVTVCSPPTATLSGSRTITAGQSASLSVALTGNSPWSFTVSDGVSVVQSFSTVTTPFVFSVSPSGTKTYSISNLRNGCTGGTVYGSATVTILPVTCPPGTVLTTLKAGDWHDPATWSCGRIPTLTDSVLLRHAVTLKANGSTRLLTCASGYLIPLNKAGLVFPK